MKCVPQKEAELYFSCTCTHTHTHWQTHPSQQENGKCLLSLANIKLKSQSDSETSLISLQVTLEQKECIRRENQEMEKGKNCHEIMGQVC